MKELINSEAETRMGQRPMAKVTKQRKKSGMRLDRLTREQRDAMFENCERMRLEDGVVWIKEQYNVEVAIQTLRKWLGKERDDKAAGEQLQNIRDDKDRALLMERVIGPSSVFTDANSTLFAQAVFEEFRKPAEERDQERLIRYMELAIKAKNQELKERVIKLGYDKFHFDGARAALGHVDELQGINASPADEDEKIEQAIEILFGKTPKNTTFEPETSPDSSAATQGQDGALSVTVLEEGEKR
jgi:hypothetical protein